jgi:hypothetical protein
MGVALQIRSFEGPTGARAHDNASENAELVENPETAI